MVKERDGMRKDYRRVYVYEYTYMIEVYDRRKNKSNIKKAGKMWRAKSKVRR